MSSGEDDDFAPADSRNAQCKARLSDAVTALIEAEAPHLELPVTRDFAQQLSELVWEWTTETLAPDLEAFARHRGRTAVGLEDVALAARRNVRTKALIDAEAARLRAQKSGAAEAKKRARSGGAGGS